MDQYRPLPEEQNSNAPTHQGYPPQYQHQQAQYPTLQPNPQYQGYPQHPGQQYPQAQYTPPNTYVHVGQVPGENLNTISEVRDIDERLDHGGYKCYRVWLYILIVCGVIDLVQMIFTSAYIGNLGGFIGDVVTTVWVICQCSIEVSAMKEKDLSKATRAVTLMTIYIVLKVITIALDAIAYAGYQHYNNNNGNAAAVILAAMIKACFFLSVNVCITLNGAVRVKKLLTRRDMLLPQAGNRV